MTRWKLTIEYDGADFCGWQKQVKDPSVQQTLEEAFTKFSGETVALHTAGRTDTGVHAREQTAHVDLMRETTGEVIRDAINYYLHPHKIAILNAVQVDKTFHARFSAMGRSYRYTIINRRAPLALRANNAWHVRKPLNVLAMQPAAALLIGTHDFSTFRARNCQSKSPVRTLERLDITQKGDEFTFDVAARSFLYHQVRNMVGTLSLVGTGHWTLAEFKAAFTACDRTKGGPTAPPHGLCFWEATYPQN
jgi:tRNA pseudouridine38-40 synthase